jgi:hypothetical protein
VTHVFDYFVGVDWSGDKKTWQKGIKIALALPGADPPQLVKGPGPKERWSRNEVAKWICNVVQAKRALIGLDFAFGFPPVQQFLKGTILDWSYVEKLCAADGNFYGGTFFRAASAPHSSLVNSPWLPRMHYSASHLRATERAAGHTKGATPQSVFNAIGSAQVGPSSISGMRVLFHLQKECGSAISIWPFQSVDAAKSVIVEIFPRYFPLSHQLSSDLSIHVKLNDALAAFGSAPVLSPPASEDEGDALLSAAALRFLAGAEDAFDLPEASIRNEGWIFGIPLGAAS